MDRASQQPAPSSDQFRVVEAVAGIVSTDFSRRRGGGLPNWTEDGIVKEGQVIAEFRKSDYLHHGSRAHSGTLASSYQQIVFAVRDEQ